MSNNNENKNDDDNNDNNNLDLVIMNTFATTTVAKPNADETTASTALTTAKDDDDENDNKAIVVVTSTNDDEEKVEDTEQQKEDETKTDNNDGISTGRELSLLSADLLLDGTTFEQIMKERTRIRREKEEYHIGELRVKIQKLEQALLGETKRRIDAVTKMQADMQAEIDSVQTKLLQQMDDETLLVNKRLDVLETRIEGLEKRWKHDCYQLQEVDITKKSSHIQQILAELRVSVETERKSRLIREGRLLQSMEENSKLFSEKFESQEQCRTKAIAELSQSIDEQQATRHQQQMELEQRLSEELELLKQELTVEVQERKLQDESIVAALNRYTQGFQQSLSILTEDE